MMNFLGKFLRLAGWTGMGVILLAALYLGLREDSCFFSVPWIPGAVAVQIQHATMYRNLLGFALLGSYAGLVLGASLLPRAGGRWRWVTIGLLLLPAIKELLQIPLPTRHGTLLGTIQGTLGVVIGLGLGNGLRAVAGRLALAAWPSPGTASQASGSSRVRLDLFDPKLGMQRGKPGWYEALWYLVKCLFFLSPLPWPRGVRVALLRLFGAKVGAGVVIKPRVNIHFPWKLEMGDHCWLGEEVFVLNFEPVRLGAHTCISQRAFLCGGNHDYRDPRFRYRNAPIVVEDGAWIGAQVFVGPGVVIGREAVVTAGSVVGMDLPAGMICSGNPCEPRKPRWDSSEGGRAGE